MTTKEEIQQRVLYQGKVVSLDSFEWEGTTKEFSSNCDNLTVNFEDINDCSITVSNLCTIRAGDKCHIYAGARANIYTGDYCKIKAGASSFIRTGLCNSVDAYMHSVVKGWFNNIICADKECHISVREGSTVLVGRRSTVLPEANCVIAHNDLYDPSVIMYENNFIKLNPGEIITVDKNMKHNIRATLPLTHATFRTFDGIFPELVEEILKELKEKK